MRLCFSNGEHPDRRLDGAVLLLGSDPEADVVLPDRGLLPRHARLLSGKGGVWLELGGGARPAYVNARPVRERALVRPGDVVCIGSVQIQLRADDGDDAVIPPVAPGAEEAPESSSSVVLRGIAGPHFGRSVAVGRSLLIGRSPAAQLRLDGADIADRHAQVERHGHRLALRAISGGRIEVNGVAGADRFLSPGDQIVIGQHRFIVEAPGLAVGKDESDPTDVATSVREAALQSAIAYSAESGRGVAIWWLIAAAAVLAAVITGLLLYGPRIGA